MAEWKDKTNYYFADLKSNPLIKQELSGLDFRIDNLHYDINVAGVFSIKKRKLITPTGSKEVYKITIENFLLDAQFLGLYAENGIIYIFPVIRSKGLLFSKINKKILVDSKKNKSTFTLDPESSSLV
jgi:hypothetical protein